MYRSASYQKLFEAEVDKKINRWKREYSIKKSKEDVVKNIKSESEVRKKPQNRFFFAKKRENF